MLHFLLTASRQLLRTSWPALMLVGLLTSLPASAQVDGYTFAASTGTFTPLPATATLVPALQADDALSASLPLGFGFQFDGAVYSRVVASSNGWLSFGSPTSSSPTNNLSLLTPANIRPLVAPLWDDMGGTTLTSAARYQTSGSTPNRVFTFEWLNWEWTYAAAVPVISFQVKLYETSNRIEFIYRPEAPAPIPTNGGSASIGLAGGVGGTPASTTFLSVNGVTNLATASSASETRNIGTAPAAGRTFTFTPGMPMTCATPRNLTGNSISPTSAQLTWTVSAGTGPYTVIYGPAGFNPTATPPAAGVTTLTGVTGTSTTVTGLVASTSYQFYVQQNCPGAAGASALSNAGAFQTTCLAPTYATLPFTEGFETAWLSRCDTREVPGDSWRNQPRSGDASWRREDDGTAASWTLPAAGSYQPTGSQNSAHSARFHSYSAGNNAGVGRLDLFVNLSGPGTKVLQFDYINVSGSDSLFVELSTNGGVSFGATPLLGLGESTSFGTQLLSLPTTATATSVIRFRAKSDFLGSSDLGLDNVSISIPVSVPNCALNPQPAPGSTAVARTTSLTWTSGGNSPTSYQVYLGTSATPRLVATVTTTSYTPPTPLAPGTTYFYQIVPRNSLGAAQGCSVGSFTTTSAPTYCLTNLGGFCGSSEISSVVVAGAGLNSTGLSCATVGGQAYQAVAPTGSNTGTLLRGVSYPINVTSTSSSSLSVWIDYNRNGVYEASEWTQVSGNSTPGQPATASTTVPAAAALGETGMRVRSRDAGTVNGPGDACSQFGSGETKDFIVTIGAAPTCAPASGLSISNVTALTARLNFTAPGSGTTTVIYGPAGFNPQFAGTTLSNVTSPAQISGLLSGTSYQVYAQTTCANGSLSPLIGPLNFTTLITNDNLCGAVPLPVNNTCFATAGTTTGATATPGVPASNCPYTVFGTPLDVWYSFTTAAMGPTSTRVRISVTGGAASVLRAYSATSCTGSLTSLACSASGAGVAAPSLDLAGLAPGTTYYVSVSDFSMFPQAGNFTICATPVPNCAAPTTLTASGVTASAATLGWGPVPATGDTFELIYGPAGFDPSAGGTTLSSLTANTTTLSNLQASTQYCYYVRQVCANFNGSSTLTGPFCFTTAAALPANDEPCGALPVSSGLTTGSTVGATTSQQPGIMLPACSPATTPQDLWFSVTPTTNSLTLGVTGTAAGTVRLYTAPNCQTGPFTLSDCRSSGTSNLGFNAPIVFPGVTPGQQYYVAISGYGATDTPGAFTITTNPLATRPALLTELSVAPNPSSTGQLTVRLSGAPAGAIRLSLLNVLGQEMLAESASPRNGSLEHTLAVPKLAAGVYTLRVQLGQQVISRKVILQ